MAAELEQFDDSPPWERAQRDKPANIWPPPLDLVALNDVEPEPPRFIMEDWLPCGYATLLAGHGGVGKSGIALYLACCMALGRRFFGLPVDMCRVVYLSCEDRQNLLHWRLKRICEHLGVRVKSLAGMLDIVDLVGHPSLLYMPGSVDQETRTMSYWELERRMQDKEVLFVDGITDTYGGNENNKAEVKLYVNSLIHMIDPDEGAVMLVGHVNRPTAAQGASSEGYSGTTAWHNAVRARWYLYPEKDDEGKTGELLLELQKSNLGKSDQEMRFKWDDQKKLFLGEATEAPTWLDRKIRHEVEHEGVLTAFRQCAAANVPVPSAGSGPSNFLLVLRSTAGIPDSLRKNTPSNSRRLREIVLHLRQQGRIVEGEYRRSDRHLVKCLKLAGVP